MYIKTNNPLEQVLINSSKLHEIEDYIRHKLIKSNQIMSHDELILLSRILWGRILNSSKCSDRKLDARHSKAQMITILCLSLYVNRHISLIKKNNLYNLLSYHISKIEEYINSNNNKQYDKYYYEYCKKYVIFCKYILNINQKDAIATKLSPNRYNIILDSSDKSYHLDQTYQTYQTYQTDQTDQTDQSNNDVWISVSYSKNKKKNTITHNNEIDLINVNNNQIISSIIPISQQIELLINTSKIKDIDLNINNRITKKYFSNLKINDFIEIY